jgi:hypothetical protein
MVPMDGPQNALCTIEHSIRLTEDRDPPPRSGYRGRPRVSRLRRYDPRRIRTLISAPGETAPRLVASNDEVVRKPKTRAI